MRPLARKELCDRYIKPGDPLPDTDPLYPPANEARGLFSLF